MHVLGIAFDEQQLILVIDDERFHRDPERVH
jgi:hypothetical protein